MSLLLEDEQKKLDEQHRRDARDEAVEDVLEECLDCFWFAGGGLSSNPGEDRERFSKVLGKFWERLPAQPEEDWLRVDIVNALLDDALDWFWEDEEVMYRLPDDKEILRGVLLTAANMWGVGRV